MAVRVVLRAMKVQGVAVRVRLRVAAPNLPRRLNARQKAALSPSDSVTGVPQAKRPRSATMPTARSARIRRAPIMQAARTVVATLIVHVIAVLIRSVLAVLVPVAKNAASAALPSARRKITPTASKLMQANGGRASAAKVVANAQVANMRAASIRADNVRVANIKADNVAAAAMAGDAKAKRAFYA